MTPSPSQRPLRKDAARNRAALVATAAAAFRDDGLAVSVNEIARRADVNVATLYRHFPTKDHLLDAVFEAMLEPIAVARDEALASPGPDGTLATFVRAATRAQAEHRGLIDALTSPRAGDGIRDRVRDRMREPALALVTPIVERAHADGDLRPDFDGEDVLIVLRMISVVIESAERASKPPERYIAFALRGLR